MNCPQCNTELKEGAKFCYRCGALIPKQKRCSKCETALDSATRFCPVCGSPNLYYNPSEDKTNKPDNPVNKDETVISQIKEEPFAPLNSGAMDIPAASPVEPPRPSSVPPVVPPPVMVNPPKQSNNNLKVWVFVSVGVAVIAVVILLYTLFGDTVIEKSRSRSALADESNYDTAVVEDGYYNKYEEDSIANVVADASVEYGDYDVEPSYESEYPSSSAYVMGFHSGRNYLDGEMIHTDGRRFPFKVSFDYNPHGNPKIGNAVYDNTNYGAKIKLRATEMDDYFIRFEGNGGGKDFILEFSGEGPYYEGDAWWGDFHQDVELELR